MSKKKKMIIAALTLCVVTALWVLSRTIKTVYNQAVIIETVKPLLIAIVVSACVAMITAAVLTAVIAHYIMKSKLKDEQHRLNNINASLRSQIGMYQDTIESLRAQEREHKELREEHIQLLHTMNANTMNSVPSSEVDSRIEIERRIDAEKILSQEEIDSKTHRGSTDPEGDLAQLIGLENIKQDLLDVIAEFEFDKRREARGIKTNSRRGAHMVFLGAPGTGKTTVARIMTGILYKYGYIKENKLVEISATELTGQYLGWTTEKTKKYVSAARGGVLFLDEVYALKKQHNDYTSEATAVLVKEMEDNRSDFVVIVAGYKQPTLEWLSSNEGLRSRFTKMFTFLDYTPDECAQIFAREAKDNGFECSEEFLAQYKKYIQSIKAFSHKDVRSNHPLADLRLPGRIDPPHFANARQAENDYKKVKAHHSRNYRNYSYDTDVEDIFVAEDATCLYLYIKDEFGYELTDRGWMYTPLR